MPTTTDVRVPVYIQPTWTPDDPATQLYYYLDLEKEKEGKRRRKRGRQMLSRRLMALGHAQAYELTREWLRAIDDDPKTSQPFEQEGSDEDRQRIAVYFDQDTLVHRTIAETYRMLSRDNSLPRVAAQVYARNALILGMRAAQRLKQERGQDIRAICFEEYPADDVG